MALIDLTLTLKHIHWNVVGPHFIGVHEMLDPQYAAVSEMVDDVAERIATMGGQPLGTPGAIVEGGPGTTTALTGPHRRAPAALDHVYDRRHRGPPRGHQVAGDIDPVSEDLLIAQTGQLELFQWFVRAHLEDKAGKLDS